MAWQDLLVKASQTVKARYFWKASGGKKVIFVIKRIFFFFLSISLTFFQNEDHGWQIKSNKGTFLKWKKNHKHIIIPKHIKCETYHDAKWICKSACSNPSAIRIFGSCHQFISRLAWYNFGVFIDEFIKVFHFFIHFECDIQWTDGTIPFPMIDWTLVLKFQGTIISQGFLFHFSRKTCKDENWSILRLIQFCY